MSRSWLLSFNNMTLTRKLVLAFAAVIVVPFAALVWMLAGPTIRQSEEFAGARLQDNVVQAARLMDEMMRSSVRDTRSLVASFAYTHDSAARSNARLEEFTRHYPYFTRISLIRADGLVTTSSDPSQSGTQFSVLSSPYQADFNHALNSAAGTVLFSQSIRVPAPGAPPSTDHHGGTTLHIALLAPVHDEHGELLGVLMVEISNQHLENVLEDVRSKLPPNDHVHLLGGAGTILLSTDEQNNRNLHRPKDSNRVAAQVEATASGHLTYDTLHAGRVMAGFAHISGYGDNKAGDWCLVATVAYDTIMEPARAAFEKVAVVLVAALLAAVTFGSFLARMLSSPIRSLTATAQQLSAGDLTARAAATGRDETAALGQAFNTMAATVERQFHALEDSRNALERRVAERTEELQQQIKERERSEDDLRKSNERFRLTMLATTNVIWDWDLEKKTLWWNDNFEAVFGYAPKDIDDSLEFANTRMHPEDRARVKKSLRGAVEGSDTLWSDQYRFRRADGEYAWVVDRGYVVRDASGKAARMIGAMQDISPRKRAEAELEQINKQLLDASRRAGMAEIASNVLHNVGNVLTSVNVSVTLVADRIRQSRATGLSKLVNLFKAHEGDLGSFITNDPRGKHVPAYLAELAGQTAAEQKECLKEIESLRDNIDHIKEIVSMQQSYATVSGLKERLDPVALVEDSLRMNVGALTRHNVKLVREYEAVPHINVDKHRVLQILVNLIRNAKYACDDSGREDKTITLRMTQAEGRLQIAVIDNGVGIPAENLTRIFHHGFTTRKSGHGFGLHSGALAAKELGGSLSVHSDGPSRGATFALELPLELPTEERKTA